MPSKKNGCVSSVLSEWRHIPVSSVPLTNKQTGNIRSSRRNVRSRGNNQKNLKSIQLIQQKFKRMSFTPLMCSRACAPTSGRVHANSFSRAATVEIPALMSFQISLGSWELDFAALAVWSYFIFFFFFFSHFLCCPHLLQLLRGMLQNCFTLELQKCFVDHENSLDILSERG